MKKLLLFSVILCLATSFTAFSQHKKAEDKSKRVSPPAKVTEKTTSGTTISVDYSKPSVKGRTIGNQIAPFGQVWRTGANEATVFEVNKDVEVDGKKLPAGKYSLYTIPGEKEWIVIFNKTWDQWGSVYSEPEDALRLTVQSAKAASFSEQLTFNINKNGLVSLIWGDTQVDFKVK